jgi:hypothetical protein
MTGKAADFEKHGVCATLYPLAVGSVHGLDARSFPMQNRVETEDK